MQRKFLTKEQALQKLRQYCAYQERSHYEVKQKLWELGIKPADQDELIASLIEDDYLNEERFAVQFAGGKFRMNEWGRKKIMYALREKKVSDFCIKKALAAINEDDYEKTLNDLAEKKLELLKAEAPMDRRKKAIDYLLQKGFEHELVNKAVSSLLQK